MSVMTGKAAAPLLDGLGLKKHFPIAERSVSRTADRGM